jgi:hypothetical protein
MRTIYNKIKKTIILAAIIITGCSEDFLDLKPLALSSEETFYSDMSSIEQAVTAAYSQLNAQMIFDIYYCLGMANIPADDVECGGETTSDMPQLQNIDRMIHTSSEEDVFDKPYEYFYKGIRMCNIAIEKIPLVEEKDPDADPALLKIRTAEVRFLRAFYHFTLAQVYGGIPITDKLISTRDLPRNSLMEVYDFIETELEEILPDLPLRSELGTEIGRANRGAAEALLAKVYLYESSYAKNYPGDERFAGMEEKWELALSHAENVISSGEYSLVGYNGETFSTWWDSSYLYPGQTPAFRYIFTVDGDNSPESVWEIQNVQDALGWYESRGSYLTVFTTCRFLKNKNDDNNTNYGWSFNCPTLYLVDAFGNNDSRESNLHSSLADPSLDPRFYVTVGRENDSIYANGDAGLGWYEMELYNLPNNMIGRKFECSPDEFWNSDRIDWNEGPFNQRLIRYADVILMAAEAAFETGNQTSALNYVNMVRQRARNSGNTGYPEALSAISLEDIMHERRLELALEGHRFFDLVRWKLAYHYINGIDLDAGYNNVEFVESKHEFFPLSDLEIQISGGNLEQYPAWQ